MRTTGIVVAAIMATVLIGGCSEHHASKSESTSLKAGQAPGTRLPPSALTGSPSRPLPSPTPLPTTLPANCGKPIPSPAFPEGWPTVFPLPVNLVLTTSTESGGALRITGVSGQALPEDAAHLKQGMTKAGINASNTRTSATETSSSFSTDDYVGEWLLRPIPECPGHTLLIMSVVLL